MRLVDAGQHYQKRTLHMSISPPDADVQRALCPFRHGMMGGSACITVCRMNSIVGGAAEATAPHMTS